MKVIHIAENTDGYEIVTLLANNVNRHNSFTVIENDDGKIFYSGGFIINDTPRIRAIFDAIPKEDHYKFAREFKSDPFARPYLEEPYGEEELKEARRTTLKEKMDKWDKLAEDNFLNKHNLSTSERQDWVDELNDLN